MMNHKRYFNGGINADSDFELVEPNQWVNASNIRTFSTDGGATNRIESVGGTSLLYSSLPTGTNYCMGGCEDEENNWILWFNYNSGGEHGIYCYSKAAGAGYKVLLSSQASGSFIVSKDSYIHSCGVINGILYWTDGEPRRINIKAGINMNHAGTFPTVTAYTSPINKNTISLIRRPPSYAVGCLAVNSGFSYNLVAGKAFRFAWRFGYRDNEISVLSLWSNVVDLRGTAGTTNDSISVGCAVTDLIYQDVQYVDLVVQYESGKAAIIKTWDKSITADAAAIAAHNTGTPLTYLFSNNQAAISLDDITTVKPFENIPLTASCLAIAKNRLFLSNYTIGYDSPKVTSLAFYAANTGTLTANARFFKSESAYNTGIVFWDDSGRRSGVVKGPRITTIDMAYYTAAPTRVTDIVLTLSNTNALTEIPNWAYYYSIVRTKCLRTSFFLQGYFNPSGFVYVYKDRTTGVLSFSTTYTATPYGLAIDLDVAIAAGLGYEFTEGSGDVLKIYLSTGAVLKKPIIATNSTAVIIPWDSAYSTSLAGIQGLYEIYTPAQNNDDDVFYEVGAKYAVTSPTTNSRVYSINSPQLYGDTWALYRNITPTTGITLESMSSSDLYWQQWFRSETNPNKVDKIGKKTIGNGILFSDVLIPGTKVNGLSSFGALNEVILDPENGAINKLELVQKVQTDGTVMLAICAYETVSCYLGEQELFDTKGSAFVARADNVIGNTKTLQGGFGTADPESVTSHNGLLWWWDLRNGCAVQYSGNGLFPISKNKFSRPANLFSKKFSSLTSAAIEALGSRPYIIGGYDPHHKELLFTIPTTETTPPKGNLVDYSSPSIIYPYDIYDGQGKTLVYKTEKDMFLGDMTFQAEKFIRLGNDLYGFKNGSLYIFNQSTPANFFGTQYTAKLMYANNPKGINTFLNLGLEANKKPLFVHTRTEDPYTQSSDLISNSVSNDFTTKDGVQYALLYRDRLSPNNTGAYLAKQMIGDRLFGKALLIMLEFTVSDGHLQLRFSNVGHILNQGHNI